MPVPEVRLRAAFLCFDRDGDGELGVPDALSAIRACGVVMPDSEADQLPNQISYPQFVEWVNQRTASRDAEAELIKHFQVFDRTNSGTIDAEELRQVLKTLASIMTEQDVNHIVQDADPENTGKIRYDAFVRNLLSS